MGIVLTIIIVGIVAYYLMNKGKSRPQQSQSHPYGGQNDKIPPKRSGGYGKWVGGGLGWAMGGPIGAIMGFAFGSMFDGMKSGQYAYQPQAGTASRTQVGDFNVSLLILAAAVMKADDKVMKSELEFVKQFFARQFGAKQAENDILMLRKILQQDINVQDVSAQIRQYMDYSSRLQLLHFLFGISMADKAAHNKEIDMIETIANFLGIRQNDFQSIKAMFVKDTDSAYKILEISPEASDDEVKKAYRAMAVKYHPDKVAHLGDDIKKAATEKFQKVTAAYEEIKKRRGMN